MASQTTPEVSLTDAYLKQAVRMLVLIGILLAIAFCFFASSICIAVVLAAFMAILADPAVQFLERLRIPRYLAAALVGDGFAKWPRRLQRPGFRGRADSRNHGQRKDRSSFSSC